MNIIMASDHAGYGLKMHIKQYLENRGHHIEDMGAFSEERANWAEFGAKAASRISMDPANLVGITICGSGIGMSIVANKFRNVRSALCHDEYSAEMSRSHNDSNMLNLGARRVSNEEAERIVDVWLGTSFSAGRHAERLDYLRAQVENKNFK